MTTTLKSQHKLTNKFKQQRQAIKQRKKELALTWLFILGMVAMMALSPVFLYWKQQEIFGEKQISKLQEDLRILREENYNLSNKLMEKESCQTP